MASLGLICDLWKTWRVGIEASRLHREVLLNNSSGSIPLVMPWTRILDVLRFLSFSFQHFLDGQPDWVLHVVTDLVETIPLGVVGLWLS